MVGRNQRSSVRANFTKALRDLEDELKKKPCDLVQVDALFRRLQSRREKLTDLDNRVEQELMMDEDTPQETFDEEYQLVNQYANQFTDIEAVVQRKLNQKDEFETASNGGEAKKKKYKLPKLEIKKFSGDAKEWLGFESQFASIHLDEEMSPQDKFQYLIQATVEKSAARAVVDSFPPTAENYPKAIAYLEERFGKRDLLVEIYSRELIKLVINKDKNRSIAALYDQLETQLRALDTLGIKTEQTIAILYPLVESALPEDILRLWERKRSSVGIAGVDRLTSLISFLRIEVESETRVKLAKAGFTDSNKPHHGQRKWEQEEETSTAMELYSSHSKKVCIFCEKDNHASNNCYKAKQLSYDEKMKAARNKGVCLSCLQPGHFSKKCKQRPRCPVCSKNHHAILCNSQPKSNPEDGRGGGDNTSNAGTSGAAGATTLANYSSSGVLLQTLVVMVKGGGVERNIRALVDTGSQQSYISQKAAEVLQLKRVSTTRMTHCLFGGQQTQEKQHNVYDVLVGNMGGGFTAKLRVIDQVKLCGTVPHVPPGEWIEELKKAGIQLSDTGPDVRDIHLLIGADVAGTLFTGKMFNTSCGPVAMETKLGWTLMGKIHQVGESRGAANVVTSLHVSIINLQDLWRLDVIGITDPVETQTKEELMASAQRHFEDTVTLNSEGRYEVSLPWIEGHPEVSNNKASARRQLQSTYRKLEEKKDVEKIQGIFDEWLELGVIERVGKTEDEKNVSYLPHHVVYKPTSATTPARPVFNASAKSIGRPSLNDCLEKGPNLIELLPDLLLRFRWRKYGVISDIKKAFLMISVREEDRDYLRFLWRENGEEVEFRHCRVVFGVTSSPFLLAAVLTHHLKQCSEEDRKWAEILLKCLYVDNCITSLDHVHQVKEFQEAATRLLALAKMELRGWEWSRKDELWNSEDTTEIVQVLGMLWNVRKDSLSLDMRSVAVGVDSSNSELELGLSGEVSEVGSLISRECGLEIGSNKGQLTKRGLLSVAHKIFDPLGVCSAVTLVPKIILQELWKTNIGWDDLVPEETEKKFHNWSKDLYKINEIEIPRWALTEVEGKITLHVFTDASKPA